MPTSYAVYGYTLRCNKRARVLGIKCYTFPADNQKTKKKKRQWIAALNRHNWTPSNSYAVMLTFRFRKAIK